MVSMPLLSAGVAGAAPLATDWVDGHNVRTRLVVGTIPGGAGDGTSAARPEILAGVEMELADGWKTYWRTPGDAGGVPPEFDWSGSTNVAKAEVLYPAPKRMTDRAGSTIGYKKHVVFPVRVVPQTPGQPVTLKLELFFGVCHDICVPSEGSYEVTLPADGHPPLPATLAEAMKRVPVALPAKTAAAGSSGAGAPVPFLAKVETALGANPPTVTLHATFPAGTAGADVFVEGPPAEFVPLPASKGKAGDNTLVFQIDLSQGADIAALKGKPLVATIVSDAAASTAQFILE